MKKKSTEMSKLIFLEERRYVSLVIHHMEVDVTLDIEIMYLPRSLMNPYLFLSIICFKNVDFDKVGELFRHDIHDFIYIRIYPYGERD